MRPRPHWAWTEVGCGPGAGCPLLAKPGHGAPGGAVAGGDPRETRVSEAEVQPPTSCLGALATGQPSTSWAGWALPAPRTQVCWSRRWSPCWVSALWPAAVQLGSLAEAVAGEVGGIIKCLTIIQWLQRHKPSFHYLAAILSRDSSAHELLLEGSSAITDPWSQGSLQPAERGKEMME